VNALLNYDPFDSPDVPVPDANGCFATPAEGAKFMASMGVPQTPLNGKIPFMKDWPNNATTDFTKIDAWYAEYKCNFGSVMKAEVGRHYAIETDSPASRTAFKNETQKDFSAHLVIKSGPGRAHWYYKHDTESLAALANIGQTSADGFSLRLHNEQCVSPGSFHPERKTQYAVVSQGSPAAATAQEINWLKVKKNDKAKKLTIADPNDPIPEHHRNVTLTSIGGSLREKGLVYQEILAVLTRKNEECCTPPLDQDEIETISRSVSRYEVGKPNIVLHDGVPAGSHPDVISPNNIADIESDICEEDTPQIEEQELPAFPRLSGLLSQLSEAICPDIPYEFKVMAAITHWGLIRSGVDTLEGEPTLQPRFYTCFIKEPQYGKTAAMNEIRLCMKVCANYSSMSSVDSGPALVDEFSDVRSQSLMKNIGIGGVSSYPARVLLDPDEMTDLFEKSKVTSQGRNSLFTEMLKLYEGNRTGNRSRKSGKAQLDDAHLAIIAGATPDGYERMWTGTGGGSAGLQSRFILVSTANGKMPIIRKETDNLALSETMERLRLASNLEPVTVRLENDARDMMASWWTGTDRNKPSCSRIDDMVKRLLIITAVTSGRNTVDRRLMTEAVAFGDYIIAAREKFNPNDSYSYTQAFEDAIRRVGHQHNVPMTMNEYRQLVHPDRKPGGIGPFLQAWKNLITVEELKPGHVTHKGTMKYQF
jgi:hypothetical protein